MKKIKYVVGFMFDEAGSAVLLIEKKKPKWQRGKLNGIGGKLEDGETFREAMIREFKEEAGIECHTWKLVIKMCGEDWEVQVFTAITDDVHNFKTMEDEKVLLIPVEYFKEHEHISNLEWLIPMCLDVANIDYGITN